MSHCITELDTVYCPEVGQFKDTWHKLQTNVQGAILADGSNIQRVFCPVVESGFKLEADFPIEKGLAEDGETMENPMDNWKMILADLRGNGRGVVPLHVPKKDYQIHQNRDLFNSMVKAAKEVLGENNFDIATVGTLGAYSHFFMSIAIKGASEGWSVGQNDAWKSFFNLVSSHNGQVSSQTLLSVIRIVCMNTVQASISDGDATGTKSNFKHTKGSLEFVTPAVFEANLRLWTTEREKMKATLAALKGEKMSLDGFRSFAAGIHSNKSTDILSTNSFNRIGELSELFTRGKGNTGETRYDALNAFTEFYTSGNGVGNPANVKTGKRIASASFGQGNTWKLRALDVLGDAAEFDTTIKRGEILYSDKLKEMATAN